MNTWHIKHNLRVAILWVTGRDLLAPKQKPSGFFLFNTDNCRWELRLLPKSDALVISLAVGPNAFHRLLQCVILGFHWRMLPLSSFEGEVKS